MATDNAIDQQLQELDTLPTRSLLSSEGNKFRRRCTNLHCVHIIRFTIYASLGLRGDSSGINAIRDQGYQGMKEGNSIDTRIRAFVVQKFPAARKRAINDDLPLLESGIIDSLGVLDVVAFLEQSFTIKISDEELTPDNFASIKCMAAFVEKKRKQIEVSAG